MRDLVDMVFKSFYFATLNLIFVCDFRYSSFARDVISYMITCCRVAIRDYMIQTCLCVRTFFRVAIGDFGRDHFARGFFLRD